MENKIILVSDKFNSFADKQHVLTLHNFKQIEDFKTQYPTKDGVLFGQGLTNQCYTAIENYLSENNISSPSLNNLTSKNNYTHKKKTQNILIGKTDKINDHLYSLPMLIDENSELMNDHQTGQHIQGMVLVEAFRQTFIAVTEEFFPLFTETGKEQMSLYYVINTMDTNFLNFVFPLPISIIYEIEDKKIVQNKRMKFTVNIKAFQNKKICVEMKVIFSAYPQNQIANKEQSLAATAIKEVSNSNNEHTSIINFFGDKNA